MNFYGHGRLNIVVIILHASGKNPAASSSALSLSLSLTVEGSCTASFNDTNCPVHCTPHMCWECPGTASLQQTATVSPAMHPVPCAVLCCAVQY